MSKSKYKRLIAASPAGGSKIKIGNTGKKVDSGNCTPVFCFRYMNKSVEFDPCTKELRAYLAEEIMILSSLTWNTISRLPRYKHGIEFIPVRDLKRAMPKAFGADVTQVIVFRIKGNNGRLVGIRRGEKFHAIFIDRDFKLYDHGSK